MARKIKTVTYEGKFEIEIDINDDINTILEDIKKQWGMKFSKVQEQT